MPTPKHTDAEFVALWYQHGGVEPFSRATGIDRRQIQRRRKALEDKMGITLEQRNRPEIAEQTRRMSTLRRELEILDGVVLVGSDAHYTPGPATLAHRAFVKLAKELKPTAVILAGDVLDLASMSRHQPSSWERQFSVREEVESATDRMGEIFTACPRAQRFLLWGNHDAGRFDKFLINAAPMMKGMPGMTFSEHFPEWNYHGSLMINGDTMIKHYWHHGLHGAWNNVLKSGVNMVTGHTHRLLTRPYTDYRGTRYGIETGCLADVDDEQFDYGMDSPKDHRSGFVVLTFKGGRLLPPEQCEVVAGIGAVFRGSVVESLEPV